MDIFQKVKKLNLPKGQYVVFGSGPLAAHGIRETRDVDILVLPELYEKLKQMGWEEKSWKTPPPGRYLSKDNVEIVDNWNYFDYNPDPKWFINNAEIINGVPFVKLEEVVKWKKAFGRLKDLEDIKRIKKYLENK